MIYKIYNKAHCTQLEINRLNKFIDDNPSEPHIPIVYYVTNGNMGYQIIASYNEPKFENGKVNFGKYIDLTDYDERLIGF